VIALSKMPRILLNAKEPRDLNAYKHLVPTARSSFRQLIEHLMHANRRSAFGMLRRFALITFSILCFAAAAFAQPAGGKTSDSAAKPKPTSKPPTKSGGGTTAKPPRPASSSRTSQANASPASIDGKWWTSGNDFGASEVIFTQDGLRVSGEIHYSNGETGTVTGTITGKRLQFTFSDSSGRTGSGWLEQSWNLFLGGPWHNAQVRDGSWTLMRVEGKWCFGGNRNRIRTVTHNARGAFRTIDEYNEPGGGHLEGPYIFLEDEEMPKLKGDFDFRGNRVNWENGFFWTWCGRN
jgi:hypothetical protein